MIDRALALLICASCCSACKPVMPRDGSPILLRLHDEELRPVLLRAAALWAQTSVRFSLEKGAPAIVVALADDLPEGKNGLYSWLPEPLVQLRSAHLVIAAHELGHALGVRHLREDECGIMSPIDCGPEDLSADDLAAFAEGP